MLKGEEPIIVSIDTDPTTHERKLKVDRPTVGTNRKDKVTWMREQGSDFEFTVSFNNHSPFMSNQFGSKNGRISEKIVYDPECGGWCKFEYEVISVLKKGEVLILDPVIIVPKPPKA